jgi:hypothetical protein
MGLGALWLVVQGGVLFFGPRGEKAGSHFAVSYGLDTRQLLAAAEYILKGGLPPWKQIKCLGYELFLAFILWSGLGQVGVIIVQVLLTSVTAYCLYRLGFKLYDRMTGLLAASFYIGFVDIHIWNYYILTESLFTSMVIISLFLVVEWRGVWRVAASVVVVLFTCSIRPHGVAVLVPVGIYVLYAQGKQKRYKTLALLSCLYLVAASLVVKFINSMLVYVNPVRNFTKGLVIFSYKPSAIEGPRAVSESLLANKNPLLEIMLFIIAQPLFFFKLAGVRLWYFFIHTRPYFSDFHNYLILFTIVPSYVLAAWGLRSRTNYSAAKWLLVSVCVFQALIVSLTHVTWEGRFLNPILPIIFLFAAQGVANLWQMATARTS